MVCSKSGVSLPVVFRPQRDQVFRSFAIGLACLRFATSGVSLFYSGVLNVVFYFALVFNSIAISGSFRAQYIYGQEMKRKKIPNP